MGYSEVPKGDGLISFFFSSKMGVELYFLVPFPAGHMNISAECTLLSHDTHNVDPALEACVKEHELSTVLVPFSSGLPLPQFESHPFLL